MKIMERLIIKLVIFHFLLLVFFQLIFQHFQAIKDLQRITFYEGVNKNNEMPIIDTWKKQE